jgi:hypothetical protein
LPGIVIAFAYVSLHWEDELINKVPGMINSILGESPFFSELSIKEREKIISDLLWTYPELTDQSNIDDELGYEASWFMRHNY